jgi:transcriptional regulator with XRE-family HTH domain
MTVHEDFTALLERLILERFGKHGKGLFAKAMGTHAPIVSQWLKGRKPKIETITRMAEVLNYPLADLVQSFISDSHKQDLPEPVAKGTFIREDSSRYQTVRRVEDDSVRNLNPQEPLERQMLSQMLGELQARALLLPQIPEGNRGPILGQMDRIFNDVKELYSHIPHRPPKLEEKRD